MDLINHFGLLAFELAINMVYNSAWMTSEALFNCASLATRALPEGSEIPIFAGASAFLGHSLIRRTPEEIIDGVRKMGWSGIKVGGKILQCFLVFGKIYVKKEINNFKQHTKGIHPSYKSINPELLHPT